MCTHNLTAEIASCHMTCSGVLVHYNVVGLTCVNGMNMYCVYLCMCVCLCVLVYR